MNKIKNKIFIACDTTSLERARKIIKETYNKKKENKTNILDKFFIMTNS